ncbi:ferredoxin-type protein NapG [Nitrosophilus alvini]|uniref:ferredoxin-type protein NapG n=1 Tax=Nitrosophilus alvini TaxID=2714855 RepID=UPI00190B05EC|nr:ferredoxin-type protein NapG [Nitrosophilus alvini]
MDKNEKSVMTGRRRFLIQMAQNVATAGLGGLLWSAYVEEIKAAPLILRPPGARKEEEFVSLCIKCGLCVEGCPYDTLMLAKPGDNKPMGTPYFIPREVPCYMCVDIPCVPPCPTGALDAESVSSIVEGKKVFDINKARMGLAVVDEENCIAFWGIQCDACYRACPVLDHAITLEYRKNERTGKHAYLLPVVHSDACTGCGLCEHACVTKKPAIFVLPREIAMGEVGEHYIKGWEKSDEARLKEADEKQVFTRTKRSEKSPEDYLNMDEDLLSE